MTGAIQGTLQVAGSIDGDGFANTFAYTGSSKPKVSVTMPACLQGTLTTRTNNTQGIITVANAFGGTEVLGLYWVVAGVAYFAYSVAITSHDATTIHFTVGAGDVLPTDTPPTTIYVAVAQAVSGLSIPGASLQQITIRSTGIGGYNLLATATSKLTGLVTAALTFGWPLVQTPASPMFTGTVDNLQFMGFTLAPSTMTLTVLLT
jgi:hypothetical protein